ncbi:alanine/glycine:cation symporter family protein [Peribacillus frigoritolerans]|uniref:alanine/glycine:cation symporter family protein n=1 Tax=Peribacillus frigoritolerans TaxID=450367 RepID=UPI0006AC8FAE|nr:alanine/glycine:cation symporter family protein [Peribacillus frigoritolerans]KOR80805.1 sodium:alanine symporter [Bacillus sp. FJAT-21352]AZV62380.1 alanine:cation symporter family protein [Peribacillus frigoritolerans]MCY9138143.1 alanine:cation symporter family protein [Peribacillus frigoritolerans]MDM5312064.1 alanine/glycine:cation symporter family protein [Peribacillus frigoritolerans]MED4688823.1 alanine/glycine:cation symporter family protein [Peribacillus frigoritolerans]
MSEFITALNGVLWSSPVIYILLGVGLLFSILTRFLQVRHIKEMVLLMFQGKSSEAGVSSFQALSIALSGRVGTGNIAGVATAIAFGGPGAVFWMWAIAFIGAASAFVESTLAQIYKVKQDGQYRGGPAYYIEKGIGWKWFAVLFAFAALIAMAILMPGVQSNSIAAGVENAFGIKPVFTGLAIVLLLGFIIFGGVKRIANAATLIVPFMALGYILLSVVIVLMNITELPGVISLIFRSAFGLDSAFGGIIGMAIAWGVKRGVYSNEAGQGTGAHPAAAAEVSHPAKQGLVQAFSVYIDTLFVCSATAFMILFTGMYNTQAENGSYIVNNLGDVTPGPGYTQAAIDSVIPGFGAGFVAIALFFFAFTTIMAYYYIAETNIAYLMRNRNGKSAMFALKLIILAASFYGSVRTAELAWALGDAGLGIMVWLNVIAILILAKPALITLKDYEKQKKAGIDPVFNPKALGIKNADFWEREYTGDKENVS